MITAKRKEHEERSGVIEETFTCSVDTCRRKVPLRLLEFLPEENIEEGVDMILCCKKEAKEQNYIIQKYLELHHVANHSNLRLRNNPSWIRSVPFRICNQHSGTNGRPINLPEPVAPNVTHLYDLLRRESLFYMYGIKSTVKYPTETEVSRGFLKKPHLSNSRRSGRGMKPIECDIPGCDQRIVFKSYFNTRLFPIPILDSLRMQWAEAARESLGKSFILPLYGSVCEHHFPYPNRGKIVDGKLELPIVFDNSCREHLAKELAASNENIPIDTEETDQHLSFMPADKGARDAELTRCIVRCCPITSQSRKEDKTEYELFMMPNGPLGDEWIKILRKTDYQFKLKVTDVPHVCERHFIVTPRYLKSAVPEQFLSPAEATMSRMDLLLTQPELEEEVDEAVYTCPCCRDVEICSDILRRFNTKMNTLMQHVNMLCVLEGVKEVIPRQFDSLADDTELYSSDPDKVALLAGVRAAAMFVGEAKREVKAMSRTLNTMGSSNLRRKCSLYRCPSKRRTRLVDRSTFDEDLERGALLIDSETECKNLRILLAKSRTIPLCESHWVAHIENDLELAEESEDEEAIKLRQKLSIPMDFQPKFKKRRTDEVEVVPEYDGGAGTLGVKVEVHDDEEEDDRLLSNNELLQQLLGGAIAGQVTGEIGDNGEVYEGGEEDAEMEQLDNQETSIEDERVEEEEEEVREEESEEDPNEEPPELE